jgi:hypothetical protein
VGRASERASERAGERAGERADERAGGAPSERASGQAAAAAPPAVAVRRVQPVAGCCAAAAAAAPPESGRQSNNLRPRFQAGYSSGHWQTGRTTANFRLVALTLGSLASEAPQADSEEHENNQPI